MRPERLDRAAGALLGSAEDLAKWAQALHHGRVDTLRLDWLSDDRFTSVDVMVAEDTSVLVAVLR